MAETPPAEPVKASTRVWAVIFVGIAVGVVALVIFYIRYMADMLAGFGADLPAITKFMIDADGWLIVVPLSGLIPVTMLFSKDERPENETRTLFGWTVGISLASGVLFALAVWAMYQPIFALGEAI